MKRKLFAWFPCPDDAHRPDRPAAARLQTAPPRASANTSEAMVPDYTENDSYASYTGSDSGSGGFDETESLPTDAAEQKIIYTGDLNLETTDFDAATASLSALAEELGRLRGKQQHRQQQRGYRWAGLHHPHPLRTISALFRTGR